MTYINNLFPPRESLASDIQARHGISKSFFDGVFPVRICFFIPKRFVRRQMTLERTKALKIF
jgi:hypothetical protein